MIDFFLNCSLGTLFLTVLLGALAASLLAYIIPIKADFLYKLMGYFTATVAAYMLITDPSKNHSSPLGNIDILEIILGILFMIIIPSSLSKNIYPDSSKDISKIKIRENKINFLMVIGVFSAYGFILYLSIINIRN